MSLNEKIEIECPKCNTKKEMELWRSLNTSVDPAAKEKLLEGQINLFGCDKCGLKTFVSTEFLYHDMDNKFIVQYYPPELLKEKKFLNNFDSRGKIKMDDSLQKAVSLCDYMKDPHIVFSFEELVRYVTFREILMEVSSSQN